MDVHLLAGSMFKKNEMWLFARFHVELEIAKVFIKILIVRISLHPNRGQKHCRCNLCVQSANQLNSNC